jgi:methionyl-tRNA synthetase
LLRLIESDELEITPKRYKNEVLRFIESGLEDISVSRSRSRAGNWGISVPSDPQQIVYVWFDALANDITSLGYGSEPTEPADFATYWQDESSERTHLIGKGITRFHAVYWPAILLSAGLPLPRRILVHGYLTVDGQKIGKSLGNAIAPKEVCAEYGTDAFRHYLLRYIRSTQDGDFSLARLERAYNVELADKLGNLLNRLVTLCKRYTKGQVPKQVALESSDRALLEKAHTLEETIDIALANFLIHDASAALWSTIDRTNSYIEENAPWKLAKANNATSQARLHTVLHVCAQALQVVGEHLAIFLPDASQRLLQVLSALNSETDSEIVSLLFPKRA